MTLTVVSNPVRGGDVTADPALNPDLVNGSREGSYNPTDNVTLTAVAKPGYRFVNWTGDVSGVEDTTQATIVLPMAKYYPSTEKIDLTANFEKRSRFPWEWAWGGLIALLLASLGLAIVVRKRKNRPVDAGQP